MVEEFAPTDGGKVVLDEVGGAPSGVFGEEGPLCGWWGDRVREEGGGVVEEVREIADGWEFGTDGTSRAVAMDKGDGGDVAAGRNAKRERGGNEGGTK